MTTETIMIYFDDLDAMGVVHNGRYVIVFERALGAYWTRAGWPYDPGQPRFAEVFLDSLTCDSSGTISPRCCCAAGRASSASRNGLTTTALRSRSTSTGTSCPTITRRRCGRSRRYSRRPSARHRTAQPGGPGRRGKAAESAF